MALAIIVNVSDRIGSSIGRAEVDLLVLRFILVSRGCTRHELTCLLVVNGVRLYGFSGLGIGPRLDDSDSTGAVILASKPGPPIMINIARRYVRGSAGIRACLYGAYRSGEVWTCQQYGSQTQDEHHLGKNLVDFHIAPLFGFLGSRRDFPIMPPSDGSPERSEDSLLSGSVADFVSNALL